MIEDASTQSHLGKIEPYIDGPVRELEFQVSSVLNRFEEAVEKFDNKETFSSLEFNRPLSILPKLSEEIISLIQDAIVGLNLSKEDGEPNLAILPALRDVDKIALVSHSIKQYILCLDVVHSDYLINWIENDTSHWLTQLFKLKYCKTLYDSNYLEACVKLFRFLLLKKYPTYCQDGFEAFKENVPAIYYNSPAMYIAAQYICRSMGLPLRFIQEIPTFGSTNIDEAEKFRRKIEDDIHQNYVPLLCLAETEAQNQLTRYNLKIVRDVCHEHNVWLHLIGNSISLLSILRGNREEQKANSFDSISVTLGPWLNIPSLPAATLIRITEGEQENIDNIEVELQSNRHMALPLWTSIQCLGEERILNDFTQKFESCHVLYQKLKKYPCLKLLNRTSEGDPVNSSVVDLIADGVAESDAFELTVSCVIFKFFPENNELWPSSYCDKLNSWLSQVLHRELPVVPISVVEVEEYGTALRYSPFLNTPSITEADWSAFFSCLDQQLDVLSATVAQKKTMYTLLENSSRLKLIELPDWAGLGGVRYVPEAWNRDSFKNSNKDELNRLNHQIVQQLRNTDAAFSIGESEDGYSCIRFGMVGSDSDVTDLISLVETIGKQEEDSWNFIDTMAEVVKRGIQTALTDLQKESEEKLWEEGILRHVPVFGNIVNWWSPLHKENGGGIKGRSLDLTAGVIESTENIYRYHMQGATHRESQTETNIPIPPRMGSNQPSQSTE